MTGLCKAWAAAALIALAAFSAPAFAEEPVETGLRAWIATIDQSSDWQATVGAITADAPDSATVRGLSLRSETAGFSVDIPSIRVSGFTPSTDGTLHARSIAFSSGTFVAGGFTLALYETSLSDVVLPATGMAWSGGESFTAIAAALQPLSAVQLSQARALRAVVVEQFGDVQSNISYGDLTFSGWKDGKIASASAVALKSQAPSDDPLVTMTADAAETRDIDLIALRGLYDPSQAGDAWRSVAGHAEERGLAMKIGRLVIHVGSASVDDLRVRRGDTRPPPADDPLGIHSIFASLGRYSFGKLKVTDIDFGLSGLQRARLGAVTLSDASMDRIGGLAVDGFEGTADANHLRVGHFGIGGLVPPPADVLTNAVTALGGDGNVDMSSLVPQLDSVSAAEIDASIEGYPDARLNRLDLTLGNRVGNLPTSVTAAIAGADIDSRLIPEPHVQALLKRFDYDRVNLDAAAGVAWGSDGHIAIDKFNFALKGLGGLSGRADLVGPQPADAANLHGIDDLLKAVSLRDGTFTFTDETIVSRLLDEQAKRVNADPAVFREQFAKGLPLLLTFLGNPDLQKQLASALQTIIRGPGSITLTARPATTVPAADIIAAATSTPFGLLGTLGITATSASGPAPDAPIKDAASP